MPSRLSQVLGAFIHAAFRPVRERAASIWIWNLRQNLDSVRCHTEESCDHCISPISIPSLDIQNRIWVIQKNYVFEHFSSIACCRGGFAHTSWQRKSVAIVNSWVPLQGELACSTKRLTGLKWGRVESCRCALWGCKAYTVRGEVEGCFQGMCALCFGLQNWWLGAWVVGVNQGWLLEVHLWRGMETTLHLLIAARWVVMHPEDATAERRGGAGWLTNSAVKDARMFLCLCCEFFAQNSSSIFTCPSVRVYVVINVTSLTNRRGRKRFHWFRFRRRRNHATSITSIMTNSHSLLCLVSD